MKLNSKFITSASNLTQCPISKLPEIALIGRSNVGKSSLINMITGSKNLAKASKVPGKTQLMNFFDIDDRWTLVDLPGYGYAKTANTKRSVWNQNMQDFFLFRKNLVRIFVLIDANIPPQHIDLEFIQQLELEELKFDVIITKLDKTGKTNINKNISDLKQEFNMLIRYKPNIFMTSSIRRTGRDELLEYIEKIILE